MPQLGRFDETYTDPATGKPRRNASVTLYREGGTVSGAQSGTSPLTVTVRHRGKIAAADSVFVGTTTGTTYTVDSVTATTAVLSGFVGTLSLVNGDRLIPSNSLPTLYGDDQGGATTGNPLTTSAMGRAQCWMEFGAYDVIVSGGGTTTTLFSAQVTPTEAIGYTEMMNSWATGGAGTSASPWTGWEHGVVEGRPIHFPAGHYSTANLAVPVTLTNTPSKTRITGAGSGSTFIVVTGGTGQFRVYGSGAGTRVLQSVHIEGFCVVAGANNTSAALFSAENLDIGCYVGDILIDPTTAFSVSVGIQILNSENCHFGMLSVRGWSATGGAAGNVGTGLKLYTNDGIQRGNMHFAEVLVAYVTTGLSISSSGGSLDNIYFGVFKAVNGSVVDGTTAVLLATNAEQITFGDLHMEAFNNGLSATAVENLVVVNGLASQIHNVANNAGAAYTIVNGDGGKIFSRIDTVFNGIVLSGTTTRYIAQQGTVNAVTGTLFTDSSSGANIFIGIGTITGALTMNSRVIAKAAFGFDAAGTPLVVTTNTITATKGYHQIDNSGGAVTIKTISGLNDGDILILRPNTTNNVVFDETGNLNLNGTTWTMTVSRDTAVFLKSGSIWLELTHSLNG